MRRFDSFFPSHFLPRKSGTPLCGLLGRVAVITDLLSLFNCANTCVAALVSGHNHNGRAALKLAWWILGAEPSFVCEWPGLQFVLQVVYC